MIQKIHEKYINPIINFDNTSINIFNIVDLMKNLIIKKNFNLPKVWIL